MDMISAAIDTKTVTKFGVFFRYSVITPGGQLPSVSNPSSASLFQHVLQTRLPLYVCSSPFSSIIVIVG